MLDEYQKNFGESWRTVQADSTQPWPYLNEALTKFQVSVFFVILVCCSFNADVELYFSNSSQKLFLKDIIGALEELYFKNLFYSFHLQDPAEADKLLKIQRELDETKIILVRFYYFVCFPFPFSFHLSYHAIFSFILSFCWQFTLRLTL